MRSLIFTATYNERENIEDWLRRTLASCPDSELLVIDDSSPDGTGDIIGEVAGEEPRVTLISRPGKHGLASAHLQAMSYFVDRDFDLLITMDADGSHQPEQIARLIGAVGPAEFVIGTRARDGSHRAALHRRILSRGANILAQVAIPMGLSEFTTSFRAFTPKAAETVLRSEQRDNGYAFFVECLEDLHQAGIVMTEVPIDFLDRSQGKSKIPKDQILVSAGALLRLGIDRRRHRDS